MAIRILVVDDSEHFRRTAAELLAVGGYQVLDSVADGDAALASAYRACPDGVLLDINLPGRDGFAVAASLTAACPQVRILLTSADIDDVPNAALTACGAAAFVSKMDLAVTDLEPIFGALPG